MQDTINRHEARWELMHQLLRMYKKKNLGTEMLQHTTKYRGLNLGIWVHTQRQYKTRGLLSEERIQLLKNIGIIWQPREAVWEEGFQALTKFYKTAKPDVGIPKHITYGDGKKLGGWVQNQRTAKTQGKLPSERIERLEDIGFIWKLRPERGWNRQGRIVEKTSPLNGRSN